MTETNQEDLSVEDILSSIKNILVDDPNAQPEGSQTESQVIQPPALPQQTTPEEEKNEDVFDLDASMIVKDSPQTNTAPIKETENIVDSIDINKALDMANKMDLSSIPVLEDLLKEEPQTQQPTVEVAEDTIDASANIINNFAKLFAEKQQNQSPAKTFSTGNISSQISAGIESENISNMVKTAIVEQVKVSLNADFERIASGIIAEQTKLWLNQNLAGIVEKTVAAEIARVIAKVGS